MQTLGIGVSNPSSGTDSSQVALGMLDGSGVRALEVEPVEPGGRHRDDLIPACDRLMRRCGMVPGDIQCIAVDIGPGGFTGLRVAVTAAATMAMVLGARLVAVPAARVAAVRAKERSGAFAVVLATKRERGWVEVFGREDAGNPREIGTAEFAKLAEPGEPLRVVADEHLPPSWARAAADRGWSIEPIELSGESLLRAAAAQPAAVEPESLRPIYAREPEAVTLWQARHLGG